MNSPILINTRVLAAPTTGLQRYLRELISRFPSAFRTLAPRRPMGLLQSHVWEQTVLPQRKAKHELLFSPCNTGPVFLRRQVVTVHDVVPIDRPEWFSKGKAALYRFVTPRLVHRAARLITISEYSKQRLIECLGADERRISVIPNGVDARFAQQANMDVLQMRSRLNLPWAPWCSVCSTTGPMVDRLAFETKGKVRVGKLNTQTNPQLASTYNILSVPSFFIFDGGELKRHIPGAVQKHELMLEMGKYI